MTLEESIELELWRQRGPQPKDVRESMLLLKALVDQAREQATRVAYRTGYANARADIHRPGSSGERQVVRAIINGETP